MIPAIIAGHGGMIAGKYQTRGKQFTFSDGTTVHEGKLNRDVKQRVMEQLYLEKIPYIDLVPEQKDISLRERIERAERLNKEHGKKLFIVDIHFNASSSEKAGQARGSEVHISTKASKKSKLLAKISQDLFAKHFPESRFRGIKRKRWAIIHLTSMPAILIECFFMDNIYDYLQYMSSSCGLDRIAAYIVDVIKEFIRQSNKLPKAA